jgi:hypothetical protein
VLPEPSFLSERELLNKLDEMVIMSQPLLTTRYRLKKALKEEIGDKDYTLFNGDSWAIKLSKDIDVVI